ncbi:hypothetical protein GCM10010937_21910 [Gluconobacter japonicus]|uniref:Uncharacterized protein n=1 Tax=Gluconobacter japonicus TaxID=376620 RepID=A0ABQ5WK81_GLUJA|nr:hypothetical protein AA3271_2398 [Gluconobacter japonicus NBRC 3271]GLQ60388.1 hypothetical protein GCM10010937_21910 [Gluconobacter japonicus]
MRRDFVVRSWIRTKKKFRVTRVPKAGGKGEKTLKLSEVLAGDAMLSDREFSGIGLTVADLCNL